MESIRLRTAEYEMIIAQHGNFTLIVKQNPSARQEARGGVVDEKKEKGKEEGKEEVKEVA